MQVQAKAIPLISQREQKAQPVVAVPKTKIQEQVRCNRDSNSVVFFVCLIVAMLFVVLPQMDREQAEIQRIRQQREHLRKKMQVCSIETTLFGLPRSTQLTLPYSGCLRRWILRLHRALWQLWAHVYQLSQLTTCRLHRPCHPLITCRSCMHPCLLGALATHQPRLRHPERSSLL